MGGAWIKRKYAVGKALVTACVRQTKIAAVDEKLSVSERPLRESEQDNSFVAERELNGCVCSSL